MSTNNELKKFAQMARRQLREQVALRMEQVLSVDSVEVREKQSAVAQLRQQIANSSKADVVDRVAYTWFNRFCALRYMDANHYTNVGAVSPAAGNTQPEILQEAKAGFVHDDLKNYVNTKDVFDLLSNAKPSANPQLEAYRLLLVAVCNSYYKIMPFMFEEISDYTELLMPQDLLSENSVLFQLREVLTEEACQDVEVIGWLYQYYISERKDEVFEALKNNQKIEAKDIPAATQLFTPHWIVRYLVENSLGRLWLLNKPDSKLTEKMEYYIKPVEVETDYLKVASPEELKICDPACGSGHMLTYGFDLLYSIYEEEGYEPSSISSLILLKNMFGIEIDGRAGALAAFALFMKARSKDKRFFTRNVQPNVCILENVSFTDQEIKEYINAVGRDLFTEPLLETLKQFEQADNFGSLIRPILTNPDYVRQILEQKNLSGNIFLFGIHERVLKVMNQTKYLSPRYQVVITNPPYMGGKNMNDILKQYASIHYEKSKSDTYSMFIEQSLNFLVPYGYLGMITISSWMFINSHERLRKKIISECTINSFVHNGRGVWGSDFGSCSFVITKHTSNNICGEFKRLFTGQGKINSNEILAKRYLNHKQFPSYFATSSDFMKIPGNPLSYWAGAKTRELFSSGTPLREYVEPKQGLITGDNDRFLRYWYEVSINNIGFNINTCEETMNSDYSWFPFQKGGDYRKWFGNIEYVVNWKNNGYEIKNFKDDRGKLKSRPQNLDFFFREGITWSKYSISYFGVRYSPHGFMFSDAGCSAFPNENLESILGFLCSNLCSYLLSVINPTLTYQINDIGNLPIEINKLKNYQNTNCDIVEKAVGLETHDWNSFEISWEFSISPLLFYLNLNNRLIDIYSILKNFRNSTIDEIKKLEEENNSIFINSYGLQDELTSTVPIEEVTLSCNPNYRYGGTKNKLELESLLLCDTMQEFISYAVGCMFGRYSLDKPGLILANQGETLQDYLRQVPDPTFTPDEDNVLPILDGDWFNDDITERFKKFLKVTFGEDHYEENLQFIEEAIGRDIRSYFLKDFYDYHVKMYKKRPIYWFFSSPKGTFNALIYMHRYNKDTVSIILNKYLREFKSKLEARKSFVEKINNSTSVSPSEKTSALKELETLKKQLDEITTYESKVIFPLAAKQIEIDLDDGVKVNYPKFGDALAEIKGL